MTRNICLLLLLSCVVEGFGSMDVEFVNDIITTEDLVTIKDEFENCVFTINNIKNRKDGMINNRLNSSSCNNDTASFCTDAELGALGVQGFGGAECPHQHSLHDLGRPSSVNGMPDDLTYSATHKKRHLDQKFAYVSRERSRLSHHLAPRNGACGQSVHVGECCDAAAVRQVIDCVPGYSHMPDSACGSNAPT